MDLVSLLRDTCLSGVLPLSQATELAGKCSVTLAEVEKTALENGVWPESYLRHRGLFSCKEQQQLLASTVAIIGCGGLGGQVFEELARAGVGEIVVVDPDRFAAHNLNRQALCTVEEIGQFKVQAARRRGRLLNPAVTVLPFAECFSEDIFDEVSQARVVIDCLDSVADRLELADFCQVQAIPLVHGAVNQWYGQVGVQKEKPLVRELYSQVPAGKGEEKVPVLSCTVAAVASVQAAETIKLLLDLASPLHDNWQSIDLLSCEMEQVG